MSILALWLTLYGITVLIAYAFTRHAPLSVVIPFAIQGGIAVLIGWLFSIGALP